MNEGSGTELLARAAILALTWRWKQKDGRNFLQCFPGVVSLFRRSLSRLSRQQQLQKAFHQLNRWWCSASYWNIVLKPATGDLTGWIAHDTNQLTWVVQITSHCCSISLHYLILNLWSGVDLSFLSGLDSSEVNGSSLIIRLKAQLIDSWFISKDES